MTRSYSDDLHARVAAGDPAPMLIGYARISKSDGSQTRARQRDALLAVGVGAERIYQNLASSRESELGARDDRAGDGSRPVGVIRLT